MRSIKSFLMGRQRPLQFSEDCGGFDLLGNSLSHAGVYLLDDQVEPGPHFALFFRVKVKTYLHCSHAKPVTTGGPQCLAGSPQQAT